MSLNTLDVFYILICSKLSHNSPTQFPNKHLSCSILVMNIHRNDKYSPWKGKSLGSCDPNQDFKTFFMTLVNLIPHF